MNRSYKRADKVNVYTTQLDKDAGKVARRVSRVPYSFHGFDSYEVNGKILPGYTDPMHTDADACVILNESAPCTAI